MLNYKMPSVSQILFNCPRANLKSLWSKWMNTKFINKTQPCFSDLKKSLQFMFFLLHYRSFQMVSTVTHTLCFATLKIYSMVLFLKSSFLLMLLFYKGQHFSSHLLKEFVIQHIFSQPSYSHSKQIFLLIAFYTLPTKCIDKKPKS